MARRTKIWFLIGACLIAAGCILLGSTIRNHTWEDLSTVKYETNEHILEQPFQNISIDTNTADILFAPSENGVCKVVCHEQTKIKHTVAIHDGTLTLQAEDTRKWYEYIGISFGTPKITLFLPKDEYGTLSVKNSTGDIKIPADFQFESLDIAHSTGDVTCQANTSGRLRIKGSTGNIHIQNVSAEALDLQVSTGKISVSDTVCSGELKITVSTGKATLNKITCQNFISKGNTGDITLTGVAAREKLTVIRTTGDIKLDRCDGSELFLQADTGNIRGTLLTDKVFITKTSTGSINVPDSTSGGKCTLTTSTGDIKIKITK